MNQSYGFVWLAFCVPLTSARQHLSYGDCLEVKREYYQNSSVLNCVTQNVHSLQHTYMSSSYRSNRLGLSHWNPYAVRRGGCLELYYCNMMEWFWCDFKPDIWRPTDFLQCFDAVGLVIWPVKIVPEMTYNVSSGTLNPTHSQLRWSVTPTDCSEQVNLPSDIKYMHLFKNIYTVFQKKSPILLLRKLG